MERNPLYGYTAEGKNNVVFRGCQDCTIQGLHLHNVIDSEAGLMLDKCDRMHVTGCTILDCDNARPARQGQHQQPHRRQLHPRRPPRCQARR